MIKIHQNISLKIKLIFPSSCLAITGLNFTINRRVAATAVVIEGIFISLTNLLGAILLIASISNRLGGVLWCDRYSLQSVGLSVLHFHETIVKTSNYAIRYRGN